jgi:hypothetical protein
VTRGNAERSRRGEGEKEMAKRKKEDRINGIIVRKGKTALSSQHGTARLVWGA